MDRKIYGHRGEIVRYINVSDDEHKKLYSKDLDWF